MTDDWPTKKNFEFYNSKGNKNQVYPGMLKGLKATDVLCWNWIPEDDGDRCQKSTWERCLIAWKDTGRLSKPEEKQEEDNVVRQVVTTQSMETRFDKKPFKIM